MNKNILNSIITESNENKINKIMFCDKEQKFLIPEIQYKYIQIKFDKNNLIQSLLPNDTPIYLSLLYFTINRNGGNNYEIYEIDDGCHCIYIHIDLSYEYGWYQCNIINDIKIDRINIHIPSIEIYRIIKKLLKDNQDLNIEELERKYKNINSRFKNFEIL